MTTRSSGYRFVADELADAGLRVSPNTVWSLCREAGIVSSVHRRRRSGKKAGPPVHDGLVHRQFPADGPDRLWLTDITEHPTGEGKLYLCAIKDAWSGRIVGYSMDSRMKSSLAVAALNNATALCEVAPATAEQTGTICHSDRGSQGGFNWSSQYVVVRAIVGARPMLRRGCASRVSSAAEC